MGLVTTKEMFQKAYEGGYAVGAFNVNNMEIVQGITEAAGELKSPVILQVSKGARAYAGHTYLIKLVEAALIENDIPIALHLDHGPDFARQVVEYAHEKGMVVEGELGKLAGVEDDVKVDASDAMYTHPGEVQEFVERTGVDSLAIAIGTSHGAFKFRPGQKPQLRFDILEEITKRLPNFPIVLHGASSVSREYVKIIQENGGQLADAIGIPEDMLRRAAKSAVCKINIDSDLRLAMTAGVRQVLTQKPSAFDPREYLKVGRANVKELVAHKIVNVLGSDNKA